MTDTTQERVNKLVEKIEKKRKLLDKKLSRIAELEKLEQTRAVFKEIEDINYDVRRYTQDIEKMTKTLENYKAKESKAKAERLHREKIEKVERPKCLDTLIQILEDEWTFDDIEYRKKGDYRTEDQIRTDSHKKAVRTVNEMLARAFMITGEVTEYDLYLTMESRYPILNGVVRGKNGIASIQTIKAGGYNIQRLHIRTLVHELKQG